MLKKRCKGFSLAEALIFLLISTLVMMATMPILTKKHRAKDNIIHGAWACKLINGEEHHSRLGMDEKKFPDDDSSRWIKGCKLPTFPSITYVTAHVIGGGAAGGDAKVKLSDNDETKPLFPNGKTSYVIEESGLYQLYLAGEKGEDGSTDPKYVNVMLNNNFYKSCYFLPAPAFDKVATVTVKLQLNKGDIISYEQVQGTNINKDFNEENLCSTTQDSSFEYGSNEGTYKFSDITVKAGDNGHTRKYKLNDKLIVQITGSGGGYYSSSSDVCSVECKNRYVPQVKTLSLINVDIYDNNDIYEFPSDFNRDSLTAYELKSGEQVSTIMRLSSRLYYKGGAGGNKGEVKTVVIEPPDKNTKIKIGKGGEYDPNDEEKRKGKDTTFGETTAKGGKVSEEMSDDINGADGAFVDTANFLKSDGGEGGKGSIDNLEFFDEDNEFLKQLKGGNGSGAGAGGGGGGVAIRLDDVDKINTWPDDKIKEFINFVDDNGKRNVYKGVPGNGSSGAVIIEW